jgi:hypothetical protein
VSLLDQSGQPIAVFSSTSIVVDSLDGIHVAYRIQDNSNQNPCFDLRYASKVGLVWDISRIDGAGNALTHVPISIALNSSESMHVGYSNITDGIGSIRLADGGPPSWNITEVFSDGEIGTMCLDSQGYAHYCVGVKVGYVPMLAYLTNRGGPWTSEVIDGTDNVYFACISADSNDNIHILYTTVGSNHSLNYARKSGGSWETQLVDASGWYGASAFDKSGTLYVAYAVEDGLKLAWLSGGVWSNETVESNPLTDVWPSIAVDALDGIHLCYTVGTEESSTLTYAYRSGSEWTKSVVEQLDSSSLPILGFSSIAVDSEGYVHIAYVRGLMNGFDIGGGVKYATNATSVIPEFGIMPFVGVFVAAMILMIGARRQKVK